VRQHTNKLTESASRNKSSAVVSGELNRSLVAHDFSADSELALKYGVSLAQEYQAELHLLHVLSNGETSLD
jgi:nucleotide-binding universal stress UspA family protein